MPVQRLHTETRCSEIIHNGTVYLAGQLADDHGGDIVQQTRETLANVEARMYRPEVLVEMMVVAAVRAPDLTY
ncbi:hypothetical protein [Pseudomonas zhanjiangensis]|uniref:RidA family protein n=1 Tax=Pseudomonas zhanjiangensis TaxID=3239015 RepID=A0ABV3YNE9_9PSED